MNTSRTALYRHYDTHGILLYVGISLSAMNRLKQHSNESAWFNEIAATDIEWFQSRRSALVAEEIAIKSENPKFNKSKRSNTSYKSIERFNNMLAYVNFNFQTGKYCATDLHSDQYIGEFDTEEEAQKAFFQVHGFIDLYPELSGETWEQCFKRMANEAAA